MQELVAQAQLLSRISFFSRSYSSSERGVVYYHQGAVTEPSNLSGFVTTPALRMMVGER